VGHVNPRRIQRAGTWVAQETAAAGEEEESCGGDGELRCGSGELRDGERDWVGAGCA
jgi:hypothetical protein